MPDDDFYRLRRSKPSGPGQLRVPGAPRRPCPVFLPAEYQPKYPYPLVLLLHPPGSDEWETLARAPYLSNRNYIVFCPRGSRPVTPNGYGQIRWSWTEGHPADIGYLQRLLDAACQRWSTPNPRLYVIGVGQAAVLAERLAATYPAAISGLALLHPAAEHIQQGTLGQAIRPGMRLFLGVEVVPPLARSAIRRLAAHYRRLGAEVLPNGDTTKPHSTPVKDGGRCGREAVFSAVLQKNPANCPGRLRRTFFYSSHSAGSS